jgi:UDP-2,4-diacetamido-2,4,6-trideoxy-beta-L-altropyranose hydrolase
MLPAPPRSRVPAAGDEPAHAAWLGVAQDLDAEQTMQALDRAGGAVDWLVADHYAIDARWETCLRSRCTHLMVVDDLADRPHNCDLLLDQNLYPDMETRYLGLVPAGCRTLLGPRFALLRPQFAAARRDLRVRPDKVRRLLVLFGGVDADNETQKALEAISLASDLQITVDVIIGRSNPHRETLQSYCEGHPGFRLHVQTERIADLMIEADLAIGGGGVATWERCAVGLPAIAWPVSGNQRAVTAAAADYGAVYCPDPDTLTTPQDIARHIFAVLNSTTLRHHLAARAASLCDGDGTHRVAERMGSAPIVLRAATPDDCDDMHAWRNHPDTRRVSIDAQAIPYESHRAWLERSLADPGRVLLIAEQDSSPVGVLRYDFDGGIALVSLYLVPGLYGRGIGFAMLSAGESWLRDHHTEIALVRAVVLGGNAPSKAVFERCGFSKHHIVYEKALEK